MKESVFPLKRETDCHGAKAPRNDRTTVLRASYVFAATKRLVILNAERERIRIPFKRETDCHGAKAPRNDRTAVFRASYVFAATKRLVILSA